MSTPCVPVGIGASVAVDERSDRRGGGASSVGAAVGDADGDADGGGAAGGTSCVGDADGDADGAAADDAAKSGKRSARPRTGAGPPVASKATVKEYRETVPWGLGAPLGVLLRAPSSP